MTGLSSRYGRLGDRQAGQRVDGVRLRKLARDDAGAGQRQQQQTQPDVACNATMHSPSLAGARAEVYRSPVVVTGTGEGWTLSARR